MKSQLDASHFSDETAAIRYVEARMWPNGPVCPHCGTVGAASRGSMKTAWFLMHRIRLAMDESGSGPLGGEGQIIESQTGSECHARGSFRLERPDDRTEAGFRSRMADECRGRNP
jgi:hypothetical protein